MDLLDTFFNWPILRDALPLLLRGLGVTVLLGAASIALGFVAGLAVALLQAGVDITVIRDYLGHSSVATTSRYITINLQMKRDALEAFWKRAELEAKGSRKWRPSPQLLTFLETL